MHVLHCQNITFEPLASTANLRKMLCQKIRLLLTGKRPMSTTAPAQWPQPIGRTLKDTVTKLFRDELSSDNMRETTCGCCAESCLLSSSIMKPLHDLNTDLLMRTQFNEDEDQGTEDFRTPFREGPLAGLIIEPAGVHFGSNNSVDIRLCQPCALSLGWNKVPKFALVNNMYIGRVPEELQGLTAIEESMISLCRAKCWIVQLKEDKAETILPHAQTGMCSHVIIYPQRPQLVAKLLPPSIQDIVTPVCVIFIGSKKPSQAWLKNKAQPLVARADRVRRALIWLKAHNPLYHDIVINEGVLEHIPIDGLLPFHVEHVLPDEAQDVLQSRYDSHAAIHDTFASFQDVNESIPFENVVITDVEGHASSNELRAAAVRHVKDKGKDYIKVAHGEQPVNEFGNPALFPMIYPCLFPYGVGGCEDSNRSQNVSLKAHVKHLFSLADRRFQEHPSFMFTTFNIMQRRAVLLHTSLKVKRGSFASVADMFAAVCLDAIHRVLERVANGDYVTANDRDEKKVLELMKQVNVVSAAVPGSSAAREVMRNEMRGLMMHLGLPSFFVTINPADIHNPLVKFLAGSDINLDNLPASDVPQYREQAFLVAKNPTIAAKFFHLYMKAFYKTLLGFDPEQKNLTGGALGTVKGYYGCVEAQGRGTLHCHMLIWLEGGLNPNEIHDKITRTYQK